MNYADARPRIKSGDLLAFSHGDWRTISGIKTNIVRIATRSTYSHVGLAWVVAGRVFVLEAVKPKIRIYPLSTSGAFYLLPTRAHWTPEAEEFALQCVGIDYSEADAVIAYFDQLQDDDAHVAECAAYVRRVLLKCRIDLGRRATPDAIVLAAQQNGAPLFYITHERTS